MILSVILHSVSGYPTIHSSPIVRWQKVNNFSLLYVVSGANARLQPYLLLGHLDVVPADDTTKWDVPPFSAEIRDGFVYGRGTIDNKYNVIVRISEEAFLLVIRLIKTDVMSAHFMFRNPESWLYWLFLERNFSSGVPYSIQ